MWKVVYTNQGEKTLADLDPPVRKRVDKKLTWLAENFEHIRPASLRGELAGSYKLQAGDYRVIYDINREDKLIVVHKVGHRSEVYE